MSVSGFGRVPAGTIQQQRFIPRTDGPGNHPHPCDIYAPRGGPKHALIILHGGGGSKRSQAIFCRTLKSRDLILTPKDVNWTRLDFYNVIEVYPLGQKCLPENAVDNPWNPNGVDSRVPQRPDGVTAWSQGYFWSSANDPQFLRDLKTWILNEYPTVEKVHIHGHSAGGMMVKYMWRFDSTVFDHHSTVSGPTPYYWEPTPFAPNILKPMWMQMGAKDTILGIIDGIAGVGNHWADNTWRQQPAQVSYINVKGFRNPSGQWIPQLQEMIPDWKEFERARTMRANELSLPDPGAWDENQGTDFAADPGTMRVWSYDNGFLTLRRLSEPDHNYYDQQRVMLNSNNKSTSIVAEVMKWVYATPT